MTCCGRPTAPVRIITGGQTGADRGAADAARRHGVVVGGWIPSGRRSAGGPIPGDLAGFVECTGDETVRTQLNVVASDGVFIAARGHPRGGADLARTTAEAVGRPVLIVDLCRTTPREAGERLAAWMATLHEPRAVNVAGPRADDDPLIQADVEAILEVALTHPSWYTADAVTPDGHDTERHLEALYDVRWKDLVFADAKAVAIGVSAASMGTAAFLATRPPGVTHGTPATATETPAPSAVTLRDEGSFSIGVGAGLIAVLLVVSALLPRAEIAPAEKPNHRCGAWLVDFFGCWLRAAYRVFAADKPHEAGTVYYREIAATDGPDHLALLAAAPVPARRIESWSHDIRRLGLTCYYKYRFVRMACVALGVEAAAFAWLALANR